MKHQALKHDSFAIGGKVVVSDETHMYNTRRGVIDRLGSAGETTTYVHVQLEGVQTIIAFSPIQLQRDN